MKDEEIMEKPISQLREDGQLSEAIAKTTKKIQEQTRGTQA